MAERYERLLSLPENLYIEGAPVKITAGALLKDTVTGNVIAQLKITNLTNNVIKACKISIKAWEPNGDELEGIDEFTYLDLNERYNKSFADRIPVKLPDSKTREISVSVTEVVFLDAPTWRHTPCKWNPLPIQSTLTDSYSEPEMRKQYGIDINEDYMPEMVSGLYRCVCGCDSVGGKCISCGRTYTEVTEKLGQLQQNMETRLAEAIAAKKRNKFIAFMSSIAVMCIAVYFVITMYIIPTNNYKAAEALYTEGKYEEAIKVFQSLNGYSDSDVLVVEYEVAQITKAEVGETVKYGLYEQDNNTTNGKEEIEWVVLAKEGTKVLVTSKYALDCQKYNEKNEDVTWETCTMRKWLNGEFLNAAFSEEEAGNIAETTVKAEKNPKYSTDPGKDTKDKVFLLSINEVNKYFTTDEDRKCAPTEYAKSQGAWTSDNNKAYGKATCWWWLRSPGDYSSYVAVVYNDGLVSFIGDLVHIDLDCVRPAMWINLES